MAHELDIDKVNRAQNVERLLDKAVIRKFGKPEDNGVVSYAYIRALEEATRDVKLTVEDYQAAADEAKIALRKRLENRKNGGRVTSARNKGKSK